MAAIFDANWYDFSPAGSYLTYNNPNGDWDLDPTNSHFTAMALIEVPTVGVANYGIIGKKHQANNTDNWSL